MVYKLWKLFPSFSSWTAVWNLQDYLSNNNGLFLYYTAVSLIFCMNCVIRIVIMIMIINNNNSNYNNITLSVDLLPLTRLPALVNTTTAERKRYDLVQWNLLSGRRLCSTHLLRSVSHSLFFCIIYLRLCNDWQHHGMMGAFHTWGLWSGKEQVNTQHGRQWSTLLKPQIPKRVGSSKERRKLILHSLFMHRFCD